MNNAGQELLEIKITELPKENLLKTHIPLGISALSLAFAVVSLAVTCTTTLVSMRSSNYITVFNLIQEQEALHSEIMRQYEDLQQQRAYFEYHQKDTWQIEEDILKILTKRDKSIRDLLSAYEFACYQYNKDRIDRDAFKNQYFWILKKYNETDPYSDELKRYNEKPNYQYYQAINAVYKKWKPEYPNIMNEND